MAQAGAPLRPGTWSWAQDRIGPDAAKVRIHDGPEAAASAAALHADAYTVGRHIVFGAGRYEPATVAGRQLLAHELAHVAQQGARDPSAGDELAVLPAEHPAEREAEHVAGQQGPTTAHPGAAEPADQRTELAIARQPAPVIRPPVARPPARPPLRVIPGGRGAGPEPGRGSERAPIERSGSAPEWYPEPGDNSYDAIAARAGHRGAVEHLRRQQERPVATLARGGTAPSFVTEDGTRRYEWIGGATGGGSMQVRVRSLHVLDAIDHEVGQATTDADLAEIATRYLPVVGPLDDFIEQYQTGRRRTSPLVVGLPGDVPVFPERFDPGGLARIAAFGAAIDRRAQQVPALARSRLRPRREQRRGSCRIRPIAPMGNDALSAIYCHTVTGSPYSYRIDLLGPGGTPTGRWAEIDSLRGDTWFECKCGYEALLTGARGEGRARAVADRLDAQVLNHQDIARSCALDYRFVVSNERVADLLRSRWFGNVTIDVRPWEPCD